MNKHFVLKIFGHPLDRIGAGMSDAKLLPEYFASDNFIPKDVSLRSISGKKRTVGPRETW